MPKRANADVRSLDLAAITGSSSKRDAYRVVRQAGHRGLRAPGVRLPRGTAVGVGEAQEGVGKLVCVNVSFKTLSIEPK